MAFRVNLDSQESCRRAYLNYHCYKNSYGITGPQMGAIISRWGDQIPNWQNSVETNDEVKYEFDDSEFENYKTEGYNNAKEEHGDGVDMEAASARAGGDWAGATVSTAAGAGGSLIATMSGKKGADALTKFLGKGIKGGGKGKQGSVGGWVAYILSAASCVISFATALNAKKNVANKEEHAAVMSLQEGMAAQQTMLNEEVSNMEDIRDEIISLENEAQAANDDANSNIQDKKTDYDMYKRVYETLKAKIDSGQPLSETEKKLYLQVIAILGTTSTAINDEVDNASSVVNDIYGDIESFSADYDMVAETIGSVQGFTDYAAEIDEKTQKLCKSEKTAQMVNTIGAGLAAAGMVSATVILATQYAAVWPVALAISIGGAAFTALAVMAGIWSGKASQQQGQMAEEVGVEIATRQTTQDLNTKTLNKYGEEIDAYDGSLDNLSEFEVLVPDDTAAPEDAPAVPTTTPSNNGASGSSTGGKTEPTSGSSNAGGTNSTNRTSGSNNPYAPSNAGGTNGVGSTGNTNDTSAPKNSSAGYASMVDILDGKVSGTGQATYDDANRVKLSQQYANAIIYGLQIPTATQGSGFDTTEIPKIIAKLIPGFEADLIKRVMNNEALTSKYEADIINTMSGEDVGDITVDNTQKATEKLKKVINFYKPIFTAAAANGWTL